jgi:hypothetical protein
MAINQGMLGFTNKTASALSNLTTSEASDRSTVATLTQTIMALYVQLAECDIWVKT